MIQSKIHIQISDFVDINQKTKMLAFALYLYQ